MQKTYALARPLLVFGLLSAGAVLLTGCPDGASRSNSAQNSGSTSGTSGATRAECAPRSLTARLSTDGYATVTGTLPITTPEGTPVKYQVRVTRVGYTQPSDYIDVTPTTIGSTTVLELGPATDPRGQSVPFKAGDIIEIRNDCGTDTATIH